MAEAPVTRYASVGGAQVAYQVVGDGPIDLVFNHGFCHLDLQWDVAPEAAFNRRLASFSRLILFDRRGTGASERTGSSMFTWEEWADDLEAVLDAVGSPSAALFAETDAGPPAILFAATRPERVDALVLGNVSARLLVDDDYPFGWSHEEMEAILAGIEATWGQPDLVRSLFPSLAHDEASVQALSKLVRAAGTPAVIGRQFRYSYEHLDVRSMLKSVRVPTLVLQSPQPFAPPEMHRYVAEHIDGARLVELPGRDLLFFGGDQGPVIDEVIEFLTGERPDADPDRVLTTMLFTDIVASTDHAAAVGDRRWREVLDSHDELVREHLRRHRGREVNTTGDGFFASFDGPARAVRCAHAIVDAAGRLGIGLRAGVHTGECEVRGDDLAGLSVHIAARVGALSAPGEVLVSSTVHDLVIGSGLLFEPRGTHELRGVPGAWTLYASVP
jgi:class 3 adenylate cyclase